MLLDVFIFKANLLILSQSLIFDHSLFILNSIMSADRRFEQNSKEDNPWTYLFISEGE